VAIEETYRGDFQGLSDVRVNVSFNEVFLWILLFVSWLEVRGVHWFDVRTYELQM